VSPRGRRSANGQLLARELATLLVHGLLHLLGYDHETDAGAMLRRQEELLQDVRWEDLLFVRRGNLLNSSTGRSRASSMCCVVSAT